MEREFELGQAVYTVDGVEAEYVTAVPNGHIIQIVLREQEEDRERVLGTPRHVKKVFATAPVEVFDARVAALRKQEEELIASVTAQREELAAANAAVKARKDAFAKHEALQRLEDFVEGRITHVVFVKCGNPSVTTLKEALTRDGYSYSERQLKLVTLYGGSKGDLHWHLDHYSDGSGHGTNFIFPHISEQEALGHAIKMCDEAIQRWRNKDSKVYAYWEVRVDPFRAVDFLRERSLSVPDDIAQHMRQNVIDSARENRDDCVKSLAEAEAKLAEAMKE